MQIEQKILVFMKENGIALFAEADRAAWAIHIEKLGNLGKWIRRYARFIHEQNRQL